MDHHIPQPDLYPDIPDNLSVTQDKAIELLLEGQNDRQVAEALQLRRQTICDWRNHNPDFRAELTRRKRVLQAAHANRLQHITATAIDVLASDLVITKQYPSPHDFQRRQAAAVQVLKASAALNRQSQSKSSRSRPARPTSKP